LGMWQWTFNSLNQSACAVAAYLQSTCSGGSWDLEPLLPGCSTVTYSLLSACSSCQVGRWGPWSQYSTNCTQIRQPSTFPNPVPNGIRVPKWALLDITVEDSWAPSKASAVGGTPEVGPGGVMGLSGVYTIDQTDTGTQSTIGPTATQSTGNSTSPPNPPVKKSSVGAIAGGTITGVAAIAAAGLTTFSRQRKRRQAGIDGTTVTHEGSPVFSVRQQNICIFVATNETL